MKKILIIEDDKFLRELITRKLLNEAYEVSEAVDGEEIYLFDINSVVKENFVLFSTFASFGS